MHTWKRYVEANVWTSSSALVLYRYMQTWKRNVEANVWVCLQPVYTCAAMLCAAKLSNVKLDMNRLVELARSKKKELQGKNKERTAR